MNIKLIIMFAILLDSELSFTMHTNKVATETYNADFTSTLKPVNEQISSYVMSMYDSAKTLALKVSQAIKDVTFQAKTAVVNSSANVKQNIVNTSNAAYLTLNRSKNSPVELSQTGVEFKKLDKPVSSMNLFYPDITVLVEDRQLYELSLEKKIDEYKKAQAQSLISSIISLPIGSAKKIIVDFNNPQKAQDSKNNILGLVVAVDATSQFVTARGERGYELLKRSVDLIAKNAVDYKLQTYEQRKQSIADLDDALQKLGKAYQDTFLLLESSARPEEIKFVKNILHQKIKTETVESLFSSLGIQGSFSAFIKEYAQLGENPQSDKVIEFLEKQLSLQSGALMTPIGKAKLENLYKQLDLIALKRESSFSFGVHKDIENNINNLMKNITVVDPYVKTDMQVLLLQRSFNKEVVLLNIEIDFVSVTTERLKKELVDMENVSSDVPLFVS